MSMPNYQIERAIHALFDTIEAINKSLVKLRKRIEELEKQHKQK